MQQFNCRICSEVIKYDIHNSASYSSINTTENMMLGVLHTLRISHIMNNMKHINVIVVDKEGQYRAHKDSYEEEIVKREDPEKSWVHVHTNFPIELSHYLELAPPYSQAILLRYFNQHSSVLLEDILPHLMQLFVENPSDQFCTFLLGKWSFMTGKPDIHDIFSIQSATSWLYPTHLRMLSRNNPQGALLQILNDYSFDNHILEAEYAIAYAEIGLRSGQTEELDKLFLKYSEKWEKSNIMSLRIAFNYIQSYYGYNLFLQGKLDQARRLIEPAYDFSVIINHRPMMIITGNFYGSVLKNSGELEKSEVVYSSILQLAKQLADDRAEIMIMSNLGSIAFQQGNIERALEVYDHLYHSPQAQHSVNFKISAIVNKAWALQHLSRDDEAFVILKEGLQFSHLSFSYLIAIYTTYLRSVRNTKNQDLLTLIENEIDLIELSKTPNGRILIHDYMATKSFLVNDWEVVIGDLSQALLIMRNHNQRENILGIEIRLAEAYHNLYLANRDNQTYLIDCYTHLDLVRSMAIQEGYYPLVYRVTILKGLIHKSLGRSDRALSLFNQARSYVEEYQLDTFRRQIDQYVSDFETIPELHHKESTSSYFNQLQNVAQRLGSQHNKKNYTVSGLLIISKSNNWFWGGSLVIEGISDYLIGIRDVLSVDAKLIETWSYVEGTRGTLLIEHFKDLLAIAVTDGENYDLRIELIGILEKVDKFQLIDLKEEREAFLASYLKDKINFVHVLSFD